MINKMKKKLIKPIFGKDVSSVDVWRDDHNGLMFFKVIRNGVEEYYSEGIRTYQRRLKKLE